MGDTWRAIRDHASSARPGKAEGRLEDGPYVIQLALAGRGSKRRNYLAFGEALTPKNLLTIDRRSRTDLFLMEQSASTPAARSR